MCPIRPCAFQAHISDLSCWAGYGTYIYGVAWHANAAGAFQHHPGVADLDVSICFSCDRAPFIVTGCAALLAAAYGLIRLPETRTWTAADGKARQQQPPSPAPPAKAQQRPASELKEVAAGYVFACRMLSVMMSCSTRMGTPKYWVCKVSSCADDPLQYRSIYLKQPLHAWIAPNPRRRITIFCWRQWHHRAGMEAAAALSELPGHRRRQRCDLHGEIGLCSAETTARLQGPLYDMQTTRDQSDYDLLAVWSSVRACLSVYENLMRSSLTGQSAYDSAV